MADIRIHTEHGVSHQEALEHVAKVMEAGYVSRAAGIPHYCWATSFKDGFVVVAARKRKANSAESFTVYRDGNRD